MWSCLFAGFGVYGPEPRSAVLFDREPGSKTGPCVSFPACNVVEVRARCNAGGVVRESADSFEPGGRAADAQGQRNRCALGGAGQHRRGDGHRGRACSGASARLIVWSDRDRRPKRSRKGRDRKLRRRLKRMLGVDLLAIVDHRASDHAVGRRRVPKRHL